MTNVSDIHVVLVIPYPALVVFPLVGASPWNAVPPIFCTHFLTEV